MFLNCYSDLQHLNIMANMMSNGVQHEYINGGLVQITAEAELYHADLDWC